MKLADLQRSFSQAISGRAVPERTRLGVRGDRALGVRDRLEIYRYAVWSRQIESLEEDFPRLIRRLGSRAFPKLARAYLSACPSQYASLAELGRELPAFLSRKRPWSPDPILSETARLDWLELVAAATAPAAPLSAEEWARRSRLPAERIALSMSPASCLFESPWQVHRDRASRKQTRLMIYRGPEAVAIRELSAKEHLLLQGVERGETLHSLSRIAASLGVESERLSRWSSDWVACGIVAGIRILK